jgi:hypothetical protein
VDPVGADPEKMADRAPPAWFRDGLASSWREVKSYFATVWAFVRRPAAFIDLWWQGRQAAMNPIAMLATGAAIVAATRQLAGAVVGIAHPESLADAALSALGPYLHYVVLGLVMHVLLLPFARRKVTSMDSVAAVLFAGAGPAALAEGLGWLVMCAIWPFTRSTAALAVMLGVAFSVATTMIATALGSLHRTKSWQMTLAILIAFTTTGLVFGYLAPPGNFGLHWVINLHSGRPLGLGM